MYLFQDNKITTNPVHTLTPVCNNESQNTVLIIRVNKNYYFSNLNVNQYKKNTTLIRL